jgi:hypothetical protein
MPEVEHRRGSRKRGRICRPRAHSPFIGDAARFSDRLRAISAQQPTDSSWPGGEVDDRQLSPFLTSEMWVPSAPVVPTGSSWLLFSVAHGDRAFQDWRAACRPPSPTWPEYQQHAPRVGSSDRPSHPLDRLCARVAHRNDEYFRVDVVRLAVRCAPPSPAPGQKRRLSMAPSPV